MDNGQGDPSENLSRETLEQVRQALQNLKSATELITVLIDEQLAGPANPDGLRRLRAAKSSVDRAIEEIERRLSADD